MCLITELTPSFNLDTAIRTLLDSESTLNQDGISVTDVHNSTVVYAEQVCDITYLLDPVKHYVIHQRYATRGGNRPELRHPFRIDTELLLAHNGTLTASYLRTFGIEGLEPNESDTSALSKQLRRQAPLSGYSPTDLMDRLRHNIGNNIITIVGYNHVWHSKDLIELDPSIFVSNLYSLSCYDYAPTYDAGYCYADVYWKDDETCFNYEDDMYWDAAYEVDDYRFPHTPT